MRTRQELWGGCGLGREEHERAVLSFALRIMTCWRLYTKGRKEKSCLVFSPLRLRSFRAKLRCLRLACRSYEQPIRASEHMVVIALLGSVCAATERPWHALCAARFLALALKTLSQWRARNQCMRNALFPHVYRRPRGQIHTRRPET